MIRTTFTFMAILLLVNPFGLTHNKETTEVNTRQITVPDDYDKIQWAIDNASEGDTIHVKSGIYRECITVDKNNLTLVGEDRNNTIIEAQTVGNVITLKAQYVTISGFTIKNSNSYLYSGIYITNSHGNNVTYNRIIENGYGILVSMSTYNTISHNVFTLNQIYTILLSASSNNTIACNFLYNNSRGVSLSRAPGNRVVKNIAFSNNDYGILLSSSTSNTVAWNNLTSNSMYGIELSSSSGNFVIFNTASENLYGIWFEYSHQNTAQGNTMANNYKGLWLHESNNNTFFHNNFDTNTIQTYDTSLDTPTVPPSVNVWDSGYPSGGNWWSDHERTDEEPDAIVDTAYIINANNSDRFPLVDRFTAFELISVEETPFYVGVVSNSSVSNFYFNPNEGAFFNFTVSGQDAGFCRVSIPKQILWVDDGGWTVLVGEVSVSPSVSEFDDYTYLYFTYHHSSKIVHIHGTNVIPESPSIAIMLTLLIAGFTTVVGIERRFMRKKG